MSEEMINQTELTAEQEAEQLNEILKIRREKLAALCEAGQNPYEKVRFDFDTYASDIKENFEEYENKDVKIAGRIMSRRDMGKANFIDILDGKGRIQCYIRIDEVGAEVFEQYKHLLPETWRKRATHYYTEFERVEKGVEAWRRGDLETYGRLSFESGYSSIYNYETGSPELKALYEIMSHTDGIYGGRFSGAGFKGCCMALIDPAYEETIMETVKREYLKKFPDLTDRYSAHICQSADGVGR